MDAREGIEMQRRLPANNKRDYASSSTFLNSSWSNFFTTGGWWIFISGPKPRIGPLWLMPGFRSLGNLGWTCESSFALSLPDLLLADLVLPLDSATRGPGVAPQRPKIQPLAFLVMVCLGAEARRWSAATPRNRLWPFVSIRVAAAGRAAWAWALLTTVPEVTPPCVRSECLGRDW